MAPRLRRASSTLPDAPSLQALEIAVVESTCMYNWSYWFYRFYTLVEYATLTSLSRNDDAMGRMRETSLQELADTKIRIPPTLLWLGESVIFLHYRGEVTFSADSWDSCSFIETPGVFEISKDPAIFFRTRILRILRMHVFRNTAGVWKLTND